MISPKTDSMIPLSHALQLRQAKLSFPSVYLLVGVNSDELVRAHKARGVMTHAERFVPHPHNHSSLNKVNLGAKRRGIVDGSIKLFPMLLG